MATVDSQVAAHLEWLGYVQPTGLVVSASALARAGVFLPNDVEGQRRLRALVSEETPVIEDFAAFARGLLDWSFSPRGYAGMSNSPVPPELQVPLPDYGEVLRPDYAVRERTPAAGKSPWQLLVKVVPTGQDLR